jgi:hypothetical protein
MEFRHKLCSHTAHSSPFLAILQSTHRNTARFIAGLNFDKLFPKLLSPSYKVVFGLKAEIKIDKLLHSIID